MAYVVRAASTELITEDQVIQFVAGQVSLPLCLGFEVTINLRWILTFLLGNIRWLPTKKSEKLGLYLPFQDQLQAKS